MMKKKKESGGKKEKVPPPPKIIGIENEDASSLSLIGGIVEKGICEHQSHKTTPPPLPSLLPFPVARHRSHSPHWVPKTSQTSIVVVDDADGDNDDLQGFDQISVSANPVQRKPKTDLDFTRWRRDLLNTPPPPGSPQIQQSKHSSKDHHPKVNETSDKVLTNGDGSKRMSSPTDITQPRDQVSQTSLANTLGDITEDVDDSIDVSRKQRRVDPHKLVTSAFDTFSSSSTTSNNSETVQHSASIESQIDSENRARLQTMSADEIADAQSEILEKMNPLLIEALRKRGQDKLNKRTHSSSGIPTNPVVSHLHDRKNSSNDANVSPLSDIAVSPKLTTSGSQDAHKGPDNKAVQNLNHGGGNLWDVWSGRVEAVRELRFSLDGNVIAKDFSEVPKAGDLSVHSGYNADNVSERDFLRTDGDPGGAGYTIKEAVALTRSVVPGQRAIALHLLASVLDKAIQNICQNQVGSKLENAEIDWEAIWAFALGPEPELVLSLRMFLDDNHKSVVLACTKVIQCILSCDMNENIFNTSEKIGTCLLDICTAPIFRSRPEIDDGFLRGGFWKYNAKPTNIISFAEDTMDDKTEGEHTIQDDIVVAGQDFTAGLVRMGILPRIRYLFEADPSAALEECIISILIAIARHSPMGADAIMKCQRLVQTVVDRFTMKDPMEIHLCKIKSVTLLKVLARSEKNNCTYFVKKGIFHSVTWQLCRYASSIDQWLKLGTENCKLSSALVVEQLRFWKVCVQYGYCISYFSDLFPALCICLNVPTFEKLLENNVLGEFVAITEEAYLVLEALTTRLPNFYSNLQVGKCVPEAQEDKETWSWSHVGPMVDLALNWTAVKSDPCLSKFFDWQKGNRSGPLTGQSPVNSLLWVISAVMRMLSGVLERLIPEDITKLPGSRVPWLPEFVPKIGLGVIKNDFLSFSGANGKEDSAMSGSFTEYLCQLRSESKDKRSVASVSCLHGIIRVVVSIDKLVQLAKPEIQAPLSQGHVSSSEGAILADGITNVSLADLRSMLTIFTNLNDSEWPHVQSIEIFGRGGRAPGVGVGWGASGGGFWSPAVLLAQINARLFISLLEVFQLTSANNLSTVEEMTLNSQTINSVLGVCLVAGPRDVLLVDKALDILLQVPVLKYLDLCIRRYISTETELKAFGWGYKEEDYSRFTEVLTSHFKNRWLSIKNKSKSLGGKSSVGQKTSKEVTNALDTIHEELDTSNFIRQDHYCTSLVVEWARQRLPLPMHWFLSPISTINYKNPKSSNTQTSGQENLPDFLEVAKGGLFFLLGIEAMSFFLPLEIPSPVRSVPVIWKLHSLSVVLLAGMAVLEDGKSRDVYESLQNVCGQIINGVEILRFQSEIHESYSIFIETLVEQFAGVSYGDLVYGRQVAVYLHRWVEAPVRLATWNALSNARVLELLPPLENCIGKAEGYLEPVEDNESILEAYVKSWVSGALDRAATRGSIALTLVLRHLSAFIFCNHGGDKLLLRNKLVKSLLRDYSRRKQHEGMILDLIRYSKSPPSYKEEASSPLLGCNLERRINLLREACEGNSSLLNEVMKLKATILI